MSATDLFPLAAKTSIDRPLIAYAFLAQTNAAQGDLLTGLMPIFKPIARECAGKPFDPVEFSRRVEDLYQIKIHPWAVDDLAPRLEKAKLLVKTQETSYAISYDYAEISQEFDDVGEADIRYVIKRFIDFARPALEQRKLSINDNQLEDGFFKQLISMDFHAALLRPRRSQPSTTLHLTKKQEPTGQDESKAIDTAVSILCAGFILEMQRVEPRVFDLMLRIATGAMVTEAVLNIQSPAGEVSFNTLKIILDGPFVLALLDLDDSSSTNYAKNLCEQLTSHGATLQIFRHSVDEMQETLNATIRAFENRQGKGALARRLGLSTYRQYVLSVAQDLSAEIRRQSIAIVNSPTSADSLAFFSEADEQAMITALGPYENPLARERDAASIAAVMRLRRNRSVPMGRVHHAQAIFLTANQRVATRADSFTVSHKMREERDVPPAFTERYTASLLFVIFGGQGQEMTRYQLLANCAAALEPDNEIMSSMHRFLSELDPIRADHFRSLMTDDRASQHMMQLTLGEVCITSTQDAAAVIEALEERYGEEARRRYDEQLTEVKQAHSEALVQQSAHYEEKLNTLAQQQMLQAEEAEEIKRARLQDHLDLEAARHQSLRLTEQVSSLLAQQQDDTQQRLEDCVRYACLNGEYRHRELSLALSAIVLACTFGASGIVDDEYKLLLLVSALITSGASGLTFWRNPEKFFAGHIAKVRQKAFIRRAKELHVANKLSAFDIDLERGTVSAVRQ